MEQNHREIVCRRQTKTKITKGALGGLRLSEIKLSLEIPNETLISITRFSDYFVYCSRRFLDSFPAVTLLDDNKRESSLSIEFKVEPPFSKQDCFILHERNFSCACELHIVRLSVWL